MRIAFAPATDSPDDMFHHHNRVINNQAHGRGHAAERHDVETHFQDIEQQDRSGEHGRHRQDRDQCDFPVAEKNEQNECGQNHADQDCVARAMFRRDDEIALVIPVGELHSVGNLFFYLAQFRLDAVGDFHCISRRLLVNLKKDRVVAVGRNTNPLWLG